MNQQPAQIPGAPSPPCQYCDSHGYHIWMIRNAKKYKLKNSEYHPDQIRAQIKRATALLDEALKAV